MAREYARIRISIAGDGDVEQLSMPAQWLYFRILIPDPKLSHCGVTDWRPNRLVGKARGLTIDAILAAAAELEHARFALFDDITEEALVRSYIRSEELMRNPKMAVAVADAYLSVASRQLRAAIANEVHRDRADHPKYSSWDHTISREAVELLLSAPTSDQVPYVDSFPKVNGNHIANHDAVQNINQKTNQNADRDQGAETQSERQADPLHLAPTSLQPAHIGGYVGTEGHQDDDLGPEPPRRCPKHEDVDDPPLCGACAEARRANDKWNLAKRKAEQERANAAAAERIQAERHASAMAIASCELCDDDGYLPGGAICHHNPHQAETNRRGVELVRAAMRGEAELPPADDEDREP